MTNPPALPRIEEHPGVAAAEDGFVVLDGPDGVAVTMTAEAASQTGMSLIEAARLAEQQRSASTDRS